MSRVLYEPCEAVLTVKGSKFLAYAASFTDRESCGPWLEGLRTLHSKSRHLGSAIRWDVDWERWDDDGEPSGSTGRPILHALQSQEAVHTAVGVVRYFGGTLLGVPGLIRAYRGAAELALESGRWIPYVPVVEYLMTCDYVQLDRALRWIREAGGQTVEQSIDVRCILRVQIPATQSVEWERRCAEYESPLTLSIPSKDTDGNSLNP